MSDKLISANKLKDYINNSINAMTKVGVAVDGEYLWGLINDAIENAPAIDTVDLVRCKDCQYMTEHYDTDGNVPYWTCSEWDGGTDYDGYCHFGERREDVDK